MNARTPSPLKRVFSAATDKATLLDALKVAIVVGTLLNLINQGDQIFRGAFHLIHWPKLLLTFCVPFGVSVFAATRSILRSQS